MGTLRRTGRVEAVTAATPGQVWAVLADVTRVGEWSHECRSAVWLDGAHRAAVGVRYRGTNRYGRRTRWTRTCELVTVEPGRELSWTTVPTPLFPDSTRWWVTLEPAGDGTRIVQSFQVLRLHPLLDRIFYLLMKGHRDRLPALTEDMERLGRVALSEPVTASAG